MREAPLAQRLRARAVLLVLVLGLVGAWFTNFPDLHLMTAAVAADMSQDEFEQRVRTYLLEHPEVIAEALNRLEAKQGEREAADAKTALKDHNTEVFRDADSPVSGNPDGNVTLVEFFDYNCPYCRAMVPVMTQAEQGDPQLRIVYKEFPILGPNSVFAAKAALAAGRQGKYVAFHRALFQVRGQVDKDKVIEVAGTVGLDIDRMKADMQDKAIEAMLEKNIKLAQALHINGTPGFVAGDTISTGAVELSALQALVGRARNGLQQAK